MNLPSRKRKLAVGHAGAEARLVIAGRPAGAGEPHRGPHFSKHGLLAASQPLAQNDGSQAGLLSLLHALEAPRRPHGHVLVASPSDPSVRELLGISLAGAVNESRAGLPLAPSLHHRDHRARDRRSRRGPHREVRGHRRAFSHGHPRAPRADSRAVAAQVLRAAVNRRAFLGYLAGAAIASKIPPPKIYRHDETVTTQYSGLLQPGDTFTIEGEYVVNPGIFRRGKLREFTIIADVTR